MGGSRMDSLSKGSEFPLVNRMMIRLEVRVCRFQEGLQTF